MADYISYELVFKINTNKILEKIYKYKAQMSLFTIFRVKSDTISPLNFMQLIMIITTVRQLI